MFCSTSACADVPDESAGWFRRHIGMEDGAPPFIRAIAQTPDGFIWLAALDGLYRHDGVKFEHIPSPSRRPLQSDVISFLLPEPNGDLWVGHDWGGLSLVHGGRHLRVVRPRMGTVFGLARGADGTSWAVTVGAPWASYARLNGERWETVARLPYRQPYPAPPVVDRDGVLWVIHDGALWTMSADGRRSRIVVPNLPPTSALALGPDGRAWLAGGGRLRRVSATASGALVGVAPGLQVPTSGMSSFVFDGAQALWQLDQSGTLSRYETSSLSTQGKPRVLRVQRFRSDAVEHGLSPPMLLDREGSLWIASSRGLDQYRRAPFAAIPRLRSTGTADYAEPLVLRDGRGDVWIRRGEGLFHVASDGSLRRMPVSVTTPSTPCPGRQGGVWIANGRRTIDLIGGPSRRSFSLAETRQYGAQPYSPCVEDGAGRLWVQDGGTLKVLSAGGTATVRLGPDDGVPVSVLTTDMKGRVLGYVGRGSLWRFDGLHPQIIWNEKNVRLGFIEFLSQGPSYLLLGGDRGLVRYDGRRFQMLTRERLPYLSMVAGAVQTQQGDTWLQAIKGVVRIRTRDLDRAFDDPTYTPPARMFTQADGLPGTTAYLNSLNIVSDRVGRIWVGTNGGVARLDPAEVVVNRRPPGVVITSLHADGTEVRPQARTELPRAASRVEIDFAGLSFADPSNVQLRYRLLGVDANWVVAGSERRAVYANLSPGTYRFRVIAANNDGVWNRTGASIVLVMPARFYETRWFMALCIALIFGIGWAAYRLRLRAVSRQLRAQAAERADERERIARELHDTLLQSVQGLVLLFQSVAGRMPSRDPNRVLLEQTLNQADEVIEEGRNRVLDLRSSAGSGNLVLLIGHIVRTAPFETSVAVRLVSRGVPREVDPDSARETQEIVKEALFNAARHSHASHVVVELSFEASTLEVTVRDDGVGLSSKSSGMRSNGGFGITGMRERAERMGGSLAIEPDAAGGLVVRLTLPGRSVHARRSDQDMNFLTRLRRRRGR